MTDSPACGVADAVPLSHATDASVFGAKAAHLGRALGHGLPVPSGIALPWALVEGVGHDDRRCVASVVDASASLGAVAVRSSAVGEDSGRASFAGQHSSWLNVVGRAEVVDAVRAVWRSAHAPAAVAYRRRMGLPLDIRVGVVVQRLVDAEVSGVLFDSHPVTGAPEVLVEAAWGLGEAVASGAVVPDLFRLSPTGEILERRVGTKDVEIRPAPGGGTAARPVTPERARALCLDDPQLGRLRRLAAECGHAFGGSQDLEWAMAEGRLWLLQRREVTTAARGG